jgi:hypothetical protein
MFNRQWYILPTLPLSVSEKEKLGKPKEEIENLKMDLNICILMISKYNICKLNICILLFSKYNISNLNTLHIHRSYFRGHDTLPLHGVTCSAIDEQTETGPKKTPLTTHLNVRWRNKDQREKVKTSTQLMLRVVFTGACGMVQRYGRTLRMLMHSVIPSCNNMLKLPLT